MQKKIKMLMVEDNEDERLFMKEGFIQSGLYEIVGEAENGNEMLQLLHQPSFTLPDVILSDLNMPGRNGYEVIVDVKTNSSLSHIAVIILTTAPLKPYAERWKKLGACAYFTKPDTFLEYKEFAEDVFEGIRNCLCNGRINYSSTDEAVRRSAYSLLNTCWTGALVFCNSIKSYYTAKMDGNGGLTWFRSLLPDETAFE